MLCSTHKPVRTGYSTRIIEPNSGKCKHNQEFGLLDLRSTAAGWLESRLDWIQIESRMWTGLY